VLHLSDRHRAGRLLAFPQFAGRAVWPAGSSWGYQMKRFLSASAVAATMTGTALAADILPPPPPPPAVEPFAFAPWHGPYIGAALGWGWANFRDRDLVIVDPPGVVFDTAPIFGRKADGFVAEVFGGYNWQRDGFVFGIEGAFEFSDIDKTHGPFDFIVDGGPTGDITRHQEIDWLARIVGRIGFAGDRWLVAANAGVGFGDIEIAHTVFIDPDDLFTVRRSKTRTGFTAGVSAEYLLTHNVFLRGHYQFYHFGGKRHHFEIDGVGISYRDRANVHKVLVGVGFLFGAPPPPPEPVAVFN
jgi:outer membrane immunogenic protein